MKRFLTSSLVQDRSCGTRHCATLVSSFPFTVPDLLNGNRRALAKAITMVESDNPTHAHKIGALLREVRRLRPLHTGPAATHRNNVAGVTTTISRMKKWTPRIAISGSPGAGKSCFIEAFGCYLVDVLGLTVGVIAVDPSSTLTHGSILGDKTRMEKLSMHPKAFVRPSPSRGHLGGVTARCWETMQILEAAQFDVILVETVGVGQSEIAAKDMTDMMLLLVPPASGDELQGIKKGIVEVADMIVVTKNDGERALLAQQTKAAYSRAVQFRSDCHLVKPVVAISAQEGTHLSEVWDGVRSVWQQKESSGELDNTRRSQQQRHFEQYFEQELVRRAWEYLRGEAPQSTNVLDGLLADVLNCNKAPREAGETALDLIFKSQR